MLIDFYAINDPEVLQGQLSHLSLNLQWILKRGRRNSNVSADRAFRAVCECEESSIADRLQPNSHSQILRRLHLDWTQYSWSSYGTTQTTGCSTAYGTGVGITGTAYCLKFLTNSVGPSRAHLYEGWNFNSGNYLFTTDTK